MSAAALLRSDALRLTLRVLAVIPGGWVFSAIWVAAGGGLLARTGWLTRSDSVALAAMLGFVLYLVFAVWAFGQHRVARVWALTAGGSALGATVLLVFHFGG
jgi:hypothetical protein